MIGLFNLLPKYLCGGRKTQFHIQKIWQFLESLQIHVTTMAGQTNGEHMQMDQLVKIPMKIIS